jgi:hypothetical protein
MFPAKVAEWQKRQRASNTDRADMRAVPLSRGFISGILGTSISVGIGTAPSPTAQSKEAWGNDSHLQAQAMRGIQFVGYTALLKSALDLC